MCDVSIDSKGLEGSVIFQLADGSVSKPIDQVQLQLKLPGGKDVTVYSFVIESWRPYLIIGVRCDETKEHSEGEKEMRRMAQEVRGVLMIRADIRGGGSNPSTCLLYTSDAADE